MMFCTHQAYTRAWDGSWGPGTAASWHQGSQRLVAPGHRVVVVACFRGRMAAQIKPNFINYNFN